MSKMNSKNVVAMKQNFLQDQKQRIDSVQRQPASNRYSQQRGASHNPRNVIQPLSVGSVETVSSNDNRGLSALKGS